VQVTRHSFAVVFHMAKATLGAGVTLLGKRPD
jgi:hypothetical protein